MGGTKGSPGAASKDSEINEGVVKVAVLAFPFNLSSVVSSPEFVGGVEGESD